LPNRHHYAGGLKKCTIMLEIDVLLTIEEKWVLSGICIEKCGILGMLNRHCDAGVLRFCITMLKNVV
jgi:hypothetical protein